MHRALILAAAFGLASASTGALAANCAQPTAAVATAGGAATAGAAARTIDAYVQVHYDVQGMAAPRPDARSSHEIFTLIVARTIGAMASTGRTAEQAEPAPAVRAPSRHLGGHLAN